jgi:hypothetical protein
MGHNLKDLNHRHKQICAWLVANPHRNLTQCAQAFGYTPQAIYYIVNSDMFQAMYRRECKELNIAAVYAFANRLNVLQAVAVEKSIEKIEQNKASEKFISEVTKNAFAGAGISVLKNTRAEPERHVHFHVPVERQALEEARERIAARREGTSPAKVGLLEVTAEVIEDSNAA